MARTLEEFAHERAGLDAAHAQNEAGRDAFIALAHTALFAASISFVGDVAPLGEAVWRPALVLGWLCNVGGLLALTVSYAASRKAIDARRAALNDDHAPENKVLDRLNGTALWSFPAALLFLFSFVTANVVNADAEQPKPAASAATSSAAATSAGEHKRGVCACPESTKSNIGTATSIGAAETRKGTDAGSASAQLGSAEHGDRRGPAPSGTISAPTTAATSAVEEVKDGKLLSAGPR